MNKQVLPALFILIITAYISFELGKMQVISKEIQMSPAVQVAYFDNEHFETEAYSDMLLQDIFVKSGSYVTNNTAIARMNSFDTKYASGTVNIPKTLFSRYEIVHWDSLLRMKSRAGNDARYLVVRKGDHVNMSNDSIQTYLYFINQAGNVLGTPGMTYFDDLQRCPVHCPL